MPTLPPPPYRGPFSDPGRCRRPIRGAHVRPRDRGLLPWGGMPAPGVHDANGGRCGGVSTAGREDGHAHDWRGEDRNVGSSVSRKRGWVWDRVRLLLGRCHSELVGATGFTAMTTAKERIAGDLMGDLGTHGQCLSERFEQIWQEAGGTKQGKRKKEKKRHEVERIASPRFLDGGKRISNL